MPAKSLIKIGLSIIMLFIVLRMVNVDRLKLALNSISYWAVLGTVLIYAAAQFLSVIKWWLIARNAGVAASFLQTLKAFYIGVFVNSFGLGLVGGDVARGLLIAQFAQAGAKDRPGQTELISSKAPALASVVVDRIHGLFVLSCIGMAALFLNGAVPHGLVWLLVTVILGSLALWGISLLIAKLSLRQGPWYQRLGNVARAFPKEPKLLLLISALSLVFHCVQISLHALMAAAVGVTLSWGTIFATVPFVNILSSLPISWQGLGVREQGYTFFLKQYLSPEHVVVFGALWLLSVTITSAFGGIVAVVSGDLKLIRATKKGAPSKRPSIKVEAEA
jgi:uncharacterized membrane protein YbhN (UPF0104 family)